MRAQRPTSWRPTGTTASGSSKPSRAPATPGNTPSPPASVQGLTTMSNARSLLDMLGGDDPYQQSPHPEIPMLRFLSREEGLWILGADRTLMPTELTFRVDVQTFEHGWS